MKNIGLLIVLVLACNNIEAQYSNLGTSGAQFLQIPVGARAEAMAGAVSGLIDDASSVFWNPAGITKVRNLDAFFSYMDWFGLFSHSAASLVLNSNDFGSIAVSIISLNSRSVEITTELEPDGTGRYFDAGDLAIGITYAKYLTDRRGLGITAKYIYQRIWNEIAGGFAFDIGTQYRLDFQNLTIAMTMTNFGSELNFDGPDLHINIDRSKLIPYTRIVPVKYQTDDYPLPLHFQIGVGFDIYETDFALIRGAIDATHPNDNNERVLFGIEFSFFDRFYLRSGYKYNFDDQKYTFGAGANLPVSEIAVYFDYAYSIYDILPGVHRISMNVRF